MSEVFLVIHGTGGNKPDHWQEHLVRRLREAGKDVRYPQFPTPNDPDLDTWLAALRAELDDIPSDATLTVFVHSRGCILWLHHAAAGAGHGPQADRVLLVSAPHRVPEPDTRKARFYPAPLDRAGIATVSRETVIVASDDDEFTTFEQAEAYAAELGVLIYLLPGAGHISPFYGYGDWPWVLDWALRRTGLPPQGK